MSSFMEFLAQNKNPNEARINEDVIYNLRAEPLQNYIIDAFRTLESKHLKIVDWELITNENEFDPNTVNIKHIKNKKNKKFLNRMPIERSRYDLLKIRFHLKAKDGEMDYETKLLLFKRYNKYYYLIDGNKFYPIYQLVDASTYTTKDYLTMKTLLSPLTLKMGVKRKDNVLYTVTGEKFYAPEYIFCIFRGKTNPLYFYTSVLGFDNMMKYMDMYDIMRVEAFRKYDIEEEYCFPTEGGLYIKVIKYFFDNDLFVRNMVLNLTQILYDCTSLTDMHDLNYWVCKLGEQMLAKPNKKDMTKLYIKGKSILFSFSRLLDNTTRRNLKLKEFNKASPFAIVRWMMRNFNELKAKDNMDLKTKRIRMGEYMEAYLIKKLSPRMNKFMSNNDVKLKDVELLVKMEQDYLIKTVLGAKKPLLRYDNTVNDMDMFTSLKYTIKGPGAIGENSANAVNDKYRGIDQSYVGSIDLNTCSSSDPGMSGILTPFVKMYGKFFSPEPEPQSWDENFANLYCNYFDKESMPIYSLDYFYNQEKKSRKALVQLENVKHFINKDPYNEDGLIMLDVTKTKVKKIKIGSPGSMQIKSEENKDKKKTTKKKKGKQKKEKLRVIKIKRIEQEEDEEDDI